MDDEMYTVPDQMGLPSFHFMASMPRHPVPFLTLHRSLYELLFMRDTGKYNPAKKTDSFVIHQTFKTRCVTDDFHQLTLAWKALGIPYYFHDDAAIERLVRLGYKEFPQLLLIWEHCITKPVVKTDLWRLLLLYEYGGIYADLDTKPVSFQPNTTLRMDDEMYTVPDQMGLPSFHFMASMPRHPVPFLTLHQSLHELLFMRDTGKYNPAKKTGP
ncbi:glycosyltransferase [Fragilaria crotonensis]|nr:glycosyltransferase [Fragilaria crotonensis]